MNKTLKNKENNIKNTIKSYIIFLIGLFVSSFGVSFVTKSDLGTSPISSIPYVSSLNFSLTLGEFTIIFSALLILLQILILGRHFKIEQLLQIPISLMFGYFIDFSMILLKFMQPNSYFTKFICLAIGCIILGIGVYLEVLADTVMLPGESFVNSIVFRFKTEFGITKIFFDVSISLIAIIISFMLSGKLIGLGIGTIISALLVGYIARFLAKKFHFLPEKIFDIKENL